MVPHEQTRERFGMLPEIVVEERNPRNEGIDPRHASAWLERKCHAVSEIGSAWEIVFEAEIELELASPADVKGIVRIARPFEDIAGRLARQIPENFPVILKGSEGMSSSAPVDLQHDVSQRRHPSPASLHWFNHSFETLNSSAGVKRERLAGCRSRSAKRTITQHIPTMVTVRSPPAQQA